MNAIRSTGCLLLGAALMASCSERNAQAGPTDIGTGGFSADVAAGKTSVVLDSAGDLMNKGQDYQDIVRSEITKQGSNFVFVMTLAAPLPDSPPLPSWADVIVWEFFLDTDPTAFPTGYDFTKNESNPFEFFIQHRVYRSGFTDPLDPNSSAAVLVDRRPLLTGGQATLTPIKLTIEGAQITMVVDAALLGHPTTFSWGSATAAAHAGADVKNGYNNISPFDFAPDLDRGVPFAVWPQ